MAGNRCSHRPLVAIIVAGVLTLMLLQTAAGSAGAISADISPLKLEPFSGAPRTAIDVTADGFGGCSGKSGEVGGGTVYITLDDAKVRDSTTVRPNGSISTSFKVPETATPGTYTVEAHCVQDSKLVSRTRFKVVESKPIVPDLFGLDGTEAARALALAGLVLGQSTGDGETVTSQKPLAGSEVEPRSPVDIDFGTTLQLAVVPQIVGLLQREAKAALISARLRLGQISGSGDVVRSQEPVAGATVTPGSPVDITVGSVPVTVTVTVPRLIGLTREEATSVLAARRLVLGQVSGDGEKIRSQRPRAGVRVRVQSAVSVTTERGVEPPVLIQVPNLVGSKVAAARAMLVDLGLILGGKPAGDRTVAVSDQLRELWLPPARW